MSISKFGELIGVDTVIESSKPSSTTPREKLIKVIDKEINYLKQRNTLETEVRESGSKRVNFWRRSSKDSSKGLVSIKYKNKIFDFGSDNDRYKPTYFQCDYTVESVTTLLEKIKYQFEQMDDSNEMLKSL